MLMERTLLERTMEVLDRLVEAELIGPYAVGGAVAAYMYIEASLTEDLDILVSFESAGSGLLSLAPVFGRLAELGYTDFRREGLMIEGWPVQLLLVASDLDQEALDSAIPLKLPVGVARMARVLLPEHLVAIALKVGRPKDFLRVTQFLDEKAVEPAKLAALIRKHGLQASWRSFCLATGTLPDTIAGGG